jgi:hypothetical protein
VKSATHVSGEPWKQKNLSRGTKIILTKDVLQSITLRGTEKAKLSARVGRKAPGLSPQIPLPFTRSPEPPDNQRKPEGVSFVEALAVRTTGIVIRGERRSPLRHLNLIPAIWTRHEVVEVPAASMTRIDRPLRVTEALKLDVSLNDPLRTMAIAAYRRNMTASTPEAKSALLIDTYL